MEKRLTVDLPDELYKSLVKIQLESILENDKKKSFNELIKEAVTFWLKSNEKEAK